MNPHQSAGLSDHNPGRSIRDRENPLVAFDAPCSDVVLQPVSQLFGDEDRFRAFPALGISDGELLIINIGGIELQDFAHPHATPGHKFQHQTVPYFGGTEDDLVDGLFLMDLPTPQFLRPEKFLQHRCVTRIRELGLQVIADEIEEGFEVGIASVFG